nr:MAG TPA: hypothetical protein [Caudoviricetes sp.]
MKFRTILQVCFTKNFWLNRIITSKSIDCVGSSHNT